MTDIVLFILVWIYMSNIVGCFAMYGVMPLCFEVACEVCFPIGEEVPSAIMTVCYNGFSILTLVVIMVLPNASK